MTTKSFEDWSIRHGSVKRQSRNMAIGLFTFIQDRDSAEDDPDFAHGQSVIIQKDNTTWFYGRVIDIDPILDPGNEGHAYTLADPWWYLENLPFEPDWNEAADPTNPNSTLIARSRSRIILFQNADGERVSTLVQALEAITFATDLGAPLFADGFAGGPLLAFSEHTDLSCAEVVRLCLRWTPKNALAMDHSTSGSPTLYVRNRDLATVFSFAKADVANLRVKPRHDLVITGIRLYVERTNSLDEKTWRTVDRQVAGVGTFQSISQTLQVGGSQVSNQYQYVRTQVANANDLNWWKTKLTWLATATGIDGTGLPVVEGGVFTPNAGQNPAVCNELIEGATPQWLQSRTRQAVATALISYKLIDSNGGAVVKVKQPVNFTISQTDLGTNTYSRTVSATAAEDVPDDIAETLYPELNDLQYDVSLVYEAEECDGLAQVGYALNITGGRADWAAMRAHIQEIDEDIDNGSTTIKCGPSNKLTVYDYVELLRLQRTRDESYRLSERLTALASANADVQGATSTPNESGSAPEVGTKSKTFSDNPATNPSKIIVTVDDIVAAIRALTDKDIKLREVDGCTTIDCAGTPTVVACKYMLLISAPYNIASCPP